MVDRADRPHLVLEDLAPGEEDDLVIERRHDGVRFADVDLTGERLHDRELVECLVSGARLDDAVLSGSRLRETRLERVEATGVRLDGGEWREVEVDSSRVGAFDAYDATWRMVAFTGCRLGYVNLRGSVLTDVTFEHCQVEDLDLGSAEVSRLTFVDTTVDHLLVPQARLADVDLRGAALHRITDPAGLRGATVTGAQLVDLAPLLAAELGIEVG